MYTAWSGVDERAYEFSTKFDGGRRRRVVGASKLGQSNATPILLPSRESVERANILIIIADDDLESVTATASCVLHFGINMSTYACSHVCQYEGNFELIFIKAKFWDYLFEFVFKIMPSPASF